MPIVCAHLGARDSPGLHLLPLSLDLLNLALDFYSTINTVTMLTHVYHQSDLLGGHSQILHP